MDGEVRSRSSWEINPLDSSCLLYTSTAKIIRMEPYKDPDEFIKNLGAEAFEERIQKARMIESLFIEETISAVTIFGAETPTNMSAPFKASARVPLSLIHI